MYAQPEQQTGSPSWLAQKSSRCKTRAQMIWRIRAKKRQPHFVHDGMTDHPDRFGRGDPNTKGHNGEWISFNQDEEPYYPGEVGNNPFQRSKYALSHICE